MWRQKMSADKDRGNLRFRRVKKKEGRKMLAVEEKDLSGRVKPNQARNPCVSSQIAPSLPQGCLMVLSPQNTEPKIDFRSTFAGWILNVPLKFITVLKKQIYFFITCDH